MKTLIYGTDNIKVLDYLSELKKKYKNEQTYNLTGSIDVNDIVEYLQGTSMFASEELICWRPNKKTEITDEILTFIKDPLSKDLIVVVLENLPKNSKLFKFFDQTKQFTGDEKEKVFPLLDTISKKQAKLSVKLYYKLLQQQNDPIYINSMLFYQFKNILHAKFQTETFNLINTFVKSRLGSVVNNFSEDECVNIIKEIYFVDLRLKTSSVDNEVLVLNLILKIINGNLATAQYV